MRREPSKNVYGVGFSRKGMEISMASVSLTRVIEKMKLENLTPEIDVKHVKITQPDINRPALQLAGYFEHFDAKIGRAHV